MRADPMGLAIDVDGDHIAPGHVGNVSWSLLGGLLAHHAPLVSAAGAAAELGLLHDLWRKLVVVLFPKGHFAKKNTLLKQIVKNSIITSLSWTTLELTGLAKSI